MAASPISTAVSARIDFHTVCGRASSIHLVTASAAASAAASDEERLEHAGRGGVDHGDSKDESSASGT